MTDRASAPAGGGSSRTHPPTLDGRTVLLVVGGGIAAYKCLYLARRLKERGARVRPVMSPGAQHFVTATALGALSGERVFDSLTDRDAEHDVGHIRLAREADLVVVAPATASLMAAMAAGFASDLATAVLLATRAPVLIAPAMNPAMWDHPATRRNLETLTGDGVRVIGPEGGEMAERGEAGTGRMSEPDAIVALIEAMLSDGPLRGIRALVTSGPTHEPIDPVRYIANRSSGRQGHAIAGALAAMGAEVTLVSGPVAIPDPPGCRIVRVETAREMEAAAMEAVGNGLDAAIMVAAVADWRASETAATKIKKTGGGAPTLAMTLNPDILHAVGHHTKRPALVVGFAAETDAVEANASAKLARKGADWIVANDVSGDVMGGAENAVALLSADGVEHWERMGKDAVARRLAGRIAVALGRLAPDEAE